MCNVMWKARVAVCIIRETIGEIIQETIRDGRPRETTIQGTDFTTRGPTHGRPHGGLHSGGLHRATDFGTGGPTYPQKKYRGPFNVNVVLGIIAHIHSRIARVFPLRRKPIVTKGKLFRATSSIPT